MRQHNMNKVSYLEEDIKFLIELLFPKVSKSDGSFLRERERERVREERTEMNRKDHDEIHDGRFVFFASFCCKSIHFLIFRHYNTYRKWYYMQ